MVGISVRSTLFNLSVNITQMIKKEYNGPVVWGGIQPTILPEKCLHHCDVVCVGEGEKAITELADKLADGRDYHSIKNLWTTKDGVTVKNDLRPLIQDLDALPYPDFTSDNKWIINNDEIEPFFDNEHRTVYWGITSRGCAFSCTYCCNNTLKRIYHGKGKYLRRRSPKSVIDELLYVRQIMPNLNFLVFIDDIFAYDIDWLLEFSPMYKKYINYPFFCFFHSKMMTEDLAAVLSDMGVEYLCTGIQSGSEKIRRKHFNRYETNAEIIKSAEILVKYKIDIAYNIILDNPLEDDADRRETLKLLLKLPRPYDLQPTSLTHFPQTQLTEKMLEKNLIQANEVEDERGKSFECWSSVLEPKRKPEELFWDNLFFLANKKYMPGGLLLRLSHVKALRRYSHLMAFIIRELSPCLSSGVRSRVLDRTTRSQIARKPFLVRIFERLNQAPRKIRIVINKAVFLKSLKNNKLTDIFRAG